MLLAGCSTLPKTVPPSTKVVTKTVYVIKLPPKQLLALPPAVPNINTTTATQATVANWLLQKEQYTLDLKNKLIGISTFFYGQQKKLNSKK
jgi:hypothetical protein